MGADTAPVPIGAASVARAAMNPVSESLTTKALLSQIEDTDRALIAARDNA